MRIDAKVAKQKLNEARVDKAYSIVLASLKNLEHTACLDPEKSSVCKRCAAEMFVGKRMYPAFSSKLAEKAAEIKSLAAQLDSLSFTSLPD